MTSPLTDNYKKRAEEFEVQTRHYDIAQSVRPLLVDFNRDTYLTALKSMLEVVERMRGKYEWAADHAEGIAQNSAYDEALTDLKAELERSISEIANNN